MNKKIESIIIGENYTIKKAMEHIEKSGIRIVLVVNNKKNLLGVATDGDIRRALLSGKDFSLAIKNIMVKNPITAIEGTPATQLLELMIEGGIQEIPIVDVQGKVVDIALLRELKSIPLSSPDITHKEVKVINQVLSTPFLSFGPRVKEFEKQIADFVGTKYAIAVNSGTSGLHLCVKSLDIKEGDEIITAPFSFVASANCALFERAKPIFVDINEDTLCIDVNKIEEKITKKTKAILPVHIFGHPCEMDKIMALAQKYNLAVIEDACEALGSEYKGKRVGAFGELGVFAFYPNKPITTGEGGIVVTNDEKLAKLCQSLRNQGKGDSDPWLCYERLGFSYRMSELNAALGVVQMERVDEMLKKRQRVAELYNQRLSEIEGIKIPYVAPDVKISWFVYVIRIDSEKFSRADRDKIIKKLGNRGINCRDYLPPIHLQPLYVKMFGYKKGDFPITEKVSELTIALPFYNNLPEKEINYICDSLESIIKK